MWYWNGVEYKVKSWKICPFLGLFFLEIKKRWHFEFSLIRYFGNDFLFLIKWHIWVYYCWNYGSLNLKTKLKVDFWLKIGIYSRKNCPRHGSRQLPPANSWLVVRWRRPDVFNVIFEINRHLFLVFLLLTLSIVFWLSTLWAKLHNCTLLSHRNETRSETSFVLFSRTNYNACEQ